MAEKPQDAPAAETKPTETPAAPAPAPEAPKEATIAEALGENPPAPAPAPAPKAEREPKAERMVPESVVIGLKKDLRDLRRDLISGETSKSAVSASIEEIGARHNVSPEFLQELATAIQGESEAKFKKELDDALEPYKTDKATLDAERVDRVFTEHYNKSLAAMPEFQDVAQKNVIKALALQPANANKTFKELFEMAYGHLVQGKRTMETTKPKGGPSAGQIDYNRASSDSEYFKEIMADPSLKAEYNKNMEKRLKL